MVYDYTDSEMLASCALVVCLLVVCDIASSAIRSDYEGHYIQPDVQTHWGAWGSIEWCEEGTFADGFHQSIVPRLGPFGDDTALSSIVRYASCILLLR